mgnify:CR=1 FL=1
MKYTTGLPTAKFADLLIRLREEGVEGYPPSMGLRNALKAVLIYMRHNIPQAVIGEQLGVSQPTISRAIKAMTDAIVQALKRRAAHRGGSARGLRLRGGRHPLPLLEPAESPRIVVGQARDDRHERPDPGPAQRQAGVGLRSLSGVHARRGRTGRLRTARGNRPLRMDRRQGIRRKGDDHSAQEAPNGELSEAAKEANRSISRIRQAERADHRPHQVLENPPAPTTAAPCTCTHSSRPSPTHSHSTSSRTPHE